MVNIWIVIGIWFIHWIADFHMQTDEQAVGKSKNNELLTQHVFSYSLLFAFASIFWMAHTGIIKVMLFAPITFVCHWITDYFTSRRNAKLWAAKDMHNFFVSIGFDQFLHLAQLLITYWLLT